MHLPVTVQDIIKDPRSRFLLMKVEVEGLPLTLLNIFAPNQKNWHFYSQLAQLVLDNDFPNLIIAGDFNATFDPALDRSMGTPESVEWAGGGLAHFIRSTPLVEVRRLLQKERDYTCFSRAYKWLSKTDSFLLHECLLPILETSTIGPFTVSDHVPVSVSLNLISCLTRTPNSRFPSNLINNISDIFWEANGPITWMITSNTGTLLFCCGIPLKWSSGAP